ncbi:hypothetical protein [Microscilla marina]|uniref:Lipoprotein, putative n=1 Tax=Microscilla marina ATCC 23134 TaxID=313606 RepID=A1ZFW4_MICM2|nr:hypothetical protein [Microscilla marina]EAY30888.1 lipoprotein, putative [Microscilla marina ATCC 23134]
MRYQSNFTQILTYILFSLIVSSTFTACSTKPLDPDSIELGTTFFPLETGRYIDYQVEDIQFTLINDPDTNRYQIRELIAEEFQDINGDPAFRLERFRRATANNTWQLDSVWVAKRSLNQAIVIQSNLPLVKIVFPVEEGKPWDGNILNGLDQDLYEIANLNRAFAVDTFNFANTLKIVQGNDSSLVSMDKRNEVYAAEVGLVYKDSTVVTFCTETPDCFTQIESGRKSVQKVIGYGKQ